MKGKNFDPRNNKAHNGARSLENVNNFCSRKQEKVQQNDEMVKKSTTITYV